MTSSQPPAWAQDWIAMLAPARRRDAILGDLLEEYHEAQVPECGVAAADRWFARQARGFLWSASIVPGVVMVIPDLVGLVAHQFVVMAIFTLTGFHLGRSTRRVDGAFLVAPAMTIIACGLEFAVSLGMFGIPAVVHPSPAAMAALWEATDIPVQIILPIGIVLTFVGAVIGALIPSAARPRKGRV
jgi:hypothetical protein